MNETLYTQIRFVTGEDWAFLPGLLLTQVKDRYPKSEKLFSRLVLHIHSDGQAVSGVE